MTFLRIKRGVVVSRQVIIAAGVINAAQGLGLAVDMVITSGREGRHRDDSLHYSDRALDFRTKHLTASQKHALVWASQQRLGPSYQLILEQDGKTNEHLHIEWDERPR